MTERIVTRFAPSPTGFMHVGGVRTALYAWLLAKQAGNNGKFILRIEDTDKNREMAGSIEQIIASLHWLGIDWDEGVDIGGAHGPYLQSDRLMIYREWAEKLVASGRAYADPYTPEQLNIFRDEAKANKQPFLYRNHRPSNPPVWDGKTPLRLKSNPKSYTWSDAVMGELTTGSEAIDDFIIMKSDGFPTYNFAHIVDDALMGITHILRSQEFISSTPKFLNLYEALEIEPPVFATLPFVMAIDGGKKLSKRDGAKDILGYAEDGYLPEALINFLATLGWNDGTEQEIYSVDELIERFSIDRIHRSPARFDERRLLWMNGQHIRQLSIDELAKRSEKFWPEEAKNADDTYRQKVLALAQDRLKTLSDLPALSKYFFAEPTPDWTMIDSSKQLKKVGQAPLVALLATASQSLELADFNVDELQTALNDLLESTGEKPAVLFGIIRLATTWSPFSPELPAMLSLLGKEKVLNRLKVAIDAAI